MNIKNYTSSVPMETTISRIESKLAASGASGIMKTYTPAGRVASIVFKIDLAERSYTVRLPAKVHACYEAMWKDYCNRVRRPLESTKGTIMAQAERTAWKIVGDWVDIQITMITLQQAEFLEVFLPYVFDGKETFFEYQTRNKFKALPESTAA